MVIYTKHKEIAIITANAIHWDLLEDATGIFTIRNAFIIPLLDEETFFTFYSAGCKKWKIKDQSASHALISETFFLFPSLIVSFIKNVSQ